MPAQANKLVEEADDMGDEAAALQAPASVALSFVGVHQTCLERRRCAVSRDALFRALSCTPS